MRKEQRITTYRLQARMIYGETKYSDARVNGVSALTIIRRYRARRRRLLKITKASRKANR